MADVVIKARAPWEPHTEIVATRGNDVAYGFALGADNTASFNLARDSAAFTSAPDAFAKGNMITLERADGHLPWVGYIRERKQSISDPMIGFVLGDQANVLFSQATTPKAWAPRTTIAGTLIKEVVAFVNDRGHPPLFLQLGSDFGGGPAGTFETNAADLLSFLRDMSERTGWEWGLSHEVGESVVTRLIWKDRIGENREQTVFSEGKSFHDALLTEDVFGYITEAIAVGGSGTFRDRRALSVSPLGDAQPGIIGRPFDVQHERISPALMGSVVFVDQEVTGDEALAAAAKRRFSNPDVTREALSFQLVESEIDVAQCEIGALYTVSFASLRLGLGLERTVRMISMQLGEDGMIDCETEVLDDQAHP